MDDKTGKFPEGHFIGIWMGIGIAIFSGVGIPLSILLENPGFIGIGPAIGVSFGLAIGMSIEGKKKKEGKIRPLTTKEKNRRKILTTSLVLLGLLLFLYLFFSRD